MTKEIERSCATCGEDIDVTVFDSGDYGGGNYFGDIQVPADDSEIIDEYESEIAGFSVTVVEHSDYDSFEYWECDECYENIGDERSD